jgi:hypothetical protein
MLVPVSINRGVIQSNADAYWWLPVDKKENLSRVDNTIGGFFIKEFRLVSSTVIGCPISKCKCK